MKGWKIAYPVLVLIMTLLVVVIWFRKGEFIAGGESGLWLFNSSITLEKNKSIWLEFGTGLPVPSFLTRVPVMYFISLLQKYFSPVVSQVILYYLLITSGVLGMFYLSKEIILDKRKDSTAIFISLFYFFNIFSMTQIWNRLLYPPMFLWSYLPWFLFLWIKMIEKPKLKWYVLFLLSNVLFVDTFSIATFVITLWTPCYVWLLARIYSFHKEKDVKKLTKYIYRSLGITVLWIAVNFWWIYPLLKVGGDIFATSFSWEHNFGTLVSLSKQNTIWNYLFLYHGFVTGPIAFGGWYQSIIAYLLVGLVIFIFLLGLVQAIKIKKYRFLLTIALFSFFIIKGSHPPFGFAFYKWLFKNIPQAGILRNPYEKFGVVWTLSYSFFFGLGLQRLLIKFKKIKTIHILVICLLSMGVLVWPLWTGDVYHDSVRISVPEYYKQVNVYFEQFGKDGRVLITPMLGGTAKYDWGYKGVGASNYLFNKPTIANVTGNKYADTKYISLKNSLSEGESYLSHLKEMNIRYLIVQDDLDLDLDLENMLSPHDLRKMFASDSEIDEIGKFGSLTLHEYVNGTFYIFEILGNDSLELSSYQVTPTHYVVDIKNAKKPFNLVFKNTYHKLWTARIDGEEVDEHLLAYDYANAWKIDKVGTYEIDVVFKVWPWQ